MDSHGHLGKAQIVMGRGENRLGDLSLPWPHLPTADHSLACWHGAGRNSRSPRIDNEKLALRCPDILCLVDWPRSG